MNTPSEIINSILESVSEAEKAFDNMMSAHSPNAEDYRREQESIVNYWLDQAFFELRLFLEAKALPSMLEAVIADHQAAKKNLTDSRMNSWGDLYSVWAGRLRQYIRAVETTFGCQGNAQVTKDLIEILRATVYSITDGECFSHPPNDEKDVHVRIEAVLRCVFPTLLHKPAITKPIKNFQPDTGLPDVKALVEYKFAATKDDIKRIADEVLADTRGYVSKDWSNFVYVIYETKRLKSEKQWRELMRTSDVPDSTEVIVISGEDPSSSSVSSRRKKEFQRQPSRVSAV